MCPCAPAAYFKHLSQTSFENEQRENMWQWRVDRNVSVSGLCTIQNWIQNTFYIPIRLLELDLDWSSKKDAELHIECKEVALKGNESWNAHFVAFVYFYYTHQQFTFMYPKMKIICDKGINET